MSDPGTKYFIKRAVEHTMRQEDNLQDALAAAGEFLRQYYD